MRTTIITLLVICFWLQAMCAVPASAGADPAELPTNGAAWPSTPRVATGRDNLLVVKTDRSLWSMGSNLHGAVGDGTTNNRPRLVRLGTDNDWADAACGDRFALALKTDGTVWAWGQNDKGQRGDGRREDRSRPVRVGQEHDWVRIAAGPTYGLALKSDGTAWAWGQSDFSGWGRGEAYLPKTVPTQLRRDSNWTAIATTPQHTLLLNRDGISWIWMHGGLYGLGPGELRMALGASFYFLHVNSPTRFSLSPTNDWSVGLGEDGNIWLKGHNHAGEQLLPDWIWTAPDAAPTMDGGEGTYWKMIRIGTDHVVSVKSDGSLWAWGTNYAGQLGNGTTKASAVPLRIGQANDWVWASAGRAYSAGLKADGSLWMWGRRIGGESKPLASTGVPPPGTTDLLPTKVADLGLINGKSKPEAESKYSRDSRGWTPLHNAVLAARSGSNAVLVLLLANGADVNAKDKSGITPLHVAAVLELEDVAEVLLANNADVNAKDDSGRTPLDLVARGPSELSLAAGVDKYWWRDRYWSHLESLGPPLTGEDKGRARMADLLRQHGGRENKFFGP